MRMSSLVRAPFLCFSTKGVIEKSGGAGSASDHVNNKVDGKNHVNHPLKHITSWQPGAFKSARKKRMRMAWSVWVISAVFVLFQFFLQLSSGEIIGGLMKTFALTAFGAGVLVSSYYYIYVLLQVPAGMLMDRYGSRGILSAGALTVCAGSLLFATAKSAYLALLGRVLMGGGSAFAFVGCLNVISIWFPARRFAFMAAIVETAGMAGAISGNFWLADVISKWGWQQCMLFAAIFAGVLSLFLFLIVHDAPRRKNRVIVGKNATALWQGLKLLLKKPVVWINGVYSGLSFSIVTTFTALWAIPFLEVSHHIHLLQANMVDAVLYVGVAVGGPILGWLDSRTNWRRTIMIVNALFSASCLFAVIFISNLPLVAVAILLFFAGVGASGYVLTFAIANEIAAENNRATCIGFTNMLCVSFAPVLQPLIGFLVTWMNHRDGLSEVLSQSIPHFEWAMSVIPFLMVFAAGLAYFLPARR